MRLGARTKRPKRSKRCKRSPCARVKPGYLNDSHVEAGLLRELLADVTCWFRRGHERRFERLQLFGLDGGARAAALLARALLLALVGVRVLIRARGIIRLFWVVRGWFGQVGRQAAVGARRHCEAQ